MNEQPLQRNGYWYFNGGKEEIGAVRVKFEELCPGPLSIAGVLTKTTTGWTFVPVKRADSAGFCVGAAVEICGSCFFRVKELHYGANGSDETLMADLKDLPFELKEEEKRAFNRSKSAFETGEASEANLEGLCCTGIFGSALIKFMHWLGLKDEFLAVREESHVLLTRPPLTSGSKLPSVRSTCMY